MLDSRLHSVLSFLYNQFHDCHASHGICVLQRDSWVLPNRQHSQTTACALLSVLTSDPGIFAASPTLGDVL